MGLMAYQLGTLRMSNRTIADHFADLMATSHAQGDCLLTVRPFDERPSPQPSPAARLNALDGRPHDGKGEERAVAELLRNELLSHTFGKHGEYEVRTTMATRQAWQYRCSVFRHGKEIKREFFPIIIDCTRHMQYVRQANGVTEAMRLSFAMEAVDVHFTRCAALREYLLMTSIYGQQPQPAYRRLCAILVMLIGAALLTAYGVWKHPPRTDLVHLPGKPMPSVQWAQNPVVYQHPAGQPFSFPLPAFSGAASLLPVEISLEAGDQRPGWIQLHRDTRRISGIAPLAAEDRTYPLSVLAMADDGSASRLHVYLTIASQRAPRPSQPSSALKSPSLKPAADQSSQKNPRRRSTRQPR